MGYRVWEELGSSQPRAGGNFQKPRRKASWRRPPGKQTLLGGGFASEGGFFGDFLCTFPTFLGHLHFLHPGSSHGAWSSGTREGIL